MSCRAAGGVPRLGPAGLGRDGGFVVGARKGSVGEEKFAQPAGPAGPDPPSRAGSAGGLDAPCGRMREPLGVEASEVPLPPPLDRSLARSPPPLSRYLARPGAEV